MAVKKKTTKVNNSSTNKNNSSMNKNNSSTNKNNSNTNNNSKTNKNNNSSISSNNNLIKKKITSKKVLSKVKTSKLSKLNNSPKVNNKQRTNKSSESFDQRLSNCISKCHLFDDESNKQARISKNYAFFRTEEEYQNSFQDILSFEKNLPEGLKDEIDVVMYNVDKEDGLMSAFIAFDYFRGKKELIYLPTKVSSHATILNYRLKGVESKIKGRTVFLVDLSFGKANYAFLSQHAKNVIIVDDHPFVNNDLKKYKNFYSFIGNDKHCATTYSYKFFFPKKDVPLDYIYIDDSDRKLMLPFLNRGVQRYLTTYNNFKFVHSPYLPNFTTTADFEKLQELINDVSFDYKCLVGKLYDEVCNNIKMQVAQNAVKKKFLGYTVYALNYNDPVLYKMVSREMFTLADKRGDKIDLVVLFGYEFTSNAYKVFVSERHTGKKPEYDLDQIVRQVGKFHPRGGKATQYIANFYYPRNKTHDIWDLFDDDKIKKN